MSGGEQRRRRPPPPLSKASLRERAEQHLGRYRPSEAQLRRVLLRRVDRCLEHASGEPRASEERGAERAAGAALAEEVIGDLRRAGLLDDRSFAEAWVRDLHRRGVSRHSILDRLRDKGVEASLARAALATQEAAVASPELARACAYARRRHLGAARAEHRQATDPVQRRRQREKDVAALCRAGFALGIALRVVDAPDLEALLAQAEEGGPA